jgi:hypothetical protein
VTCYLLVMLLFVLLAYAAFLGFYIPPGENVADFLMDLIAGLFVHAWLNSCAVCRLHHWAQCL